MSSPSTSFLSSSSSLLFPSLLFTSFYSSFTHPLLTFYSFFYSFFYSIFLHIFYIKVIEKKLAKAFREPTDPSNLMPFGSLCHRKEEAELRRHLFGPPASITVLSAPRGKRKGGERGKGRREEGRGRERASVIARKKLNFVGTFSGLPRVQRSFRLREVRGGEGRGEERRGGRGEERRSEKFLLF